MKEVQPNVFKLTFVGMILTSIMVVIILLSFLGEAMMPGSGKGFFVFAVTYSFVIGLVVLVPLALICNTINLFVKPKNKKD